MKQNKKNSVLHSEKDNDSVILSEQLRMVYAAEKTLQLTKFGIIGLCVTLVLTGIATFSAWRAAETTLEGVRLSGRGHLGIKDFTYHRATWATDSQLEVKGFFIVPTMANAGNAPVIVTSNVLSTRVVKDGG